LLDITFCDDVQDNVANKSPLKPLTNDQKQEEFKNSSPEKLARGTENIDPYDSKHDSKVESNVQTDTMNIEGVWGDHLHKSKEQPPKKKQTLLHTKSSFFQLSRSKFESSSFTKRNPRKSLSSTKLKNKSDKNISNNLNINQTDTDSKDSFNLITDEETKSIFDEPVKVTFEDNKSVPYCINTVQQLIDGHVTSVNRNLNPGWLNRCTKYSNLEVALFKDSQNSQRLSGTSDSGMESMESSTYSPKDAVSVIHSTKSQISDEEDFICNSDSEEEFRRNKRIRNFKKRWSNQNDIQLAKRRCIEVESDTTTQSIDAIDGNAFKQISNINTNSNIAYKNDNNKNETDNINASIDDVNTNFSLSNESIKISNEKIVLGPNIDSNAQIIDRMISENVEINQTKNKFKVTDTIPKSTDFPDQESEVPSNKKIVKRHILHQKTKQISDSDPDYMEEKNRQTKIKANKTTVRTIKKSTTRRKTTKDENKPNLRRKSTRGKKSLDENNVQSSDETQERKFPIYGVETLQTIPRFAIKSTENDNLIERFSKSVCTLESDAPISSKTSTKLTDKEKLEKKIAAGTMNDNFVRINLKKKVFVRGKKSFNLSKYKKNQWKQRKKELTSSESNLDAADLIDKNGMTCFKCGESGHFSKNCSKSNTLLPLEEIDELSSFPTLEEAEKMANENAIIAHSHRIDRLPEKPSYSIAKTSSDEAEDIARLFDNNFTDCSEKNEASILGHKIPQELLSRLLPPQMDVVEPLYLTNEDGSLIKTPTEVFETLRMFGHENFRAGQEKAVMRILSGQSTLVTLSTGSGKSLCYQLPAYLYSRSSRCITLVISPLVSLMDDQVTGVPSFLSAACLHTSQTPKVREQVMRSVKDGTVNILLVSPEAVVAGEKSSGFGALLRQLPPIAFACIDEAHCISQWSHNFRPSYLMLCRILKEKLRVRTVLGLTATATKATAESIVKHLYLHDGMAGVISDMPLPKNLVLTVSKDENKDQALIALLRSERFQECHSVIVYCTRREECARIAGLLRISLQVSNKVRLSLLLAFEIFLFI